MSGGRTQIFHLIERADTDLTALGESCRGMIQSLRDVTSTHTGQGKTHFPENHAIWRALLPTG